jgi:hypothetical protein
MLHVGPDLDELRGAVPAAPPTVLDEGSGEALAGLAVEQVDLWALAAEGRVL